MVSIVDASRGKIRDKPISKKLRETLEKAAKAAGVDKVTVTSGGQAAKGTKGKRTGSTRHDNGNAADIKLSVNGRTLNFTNPADRAVFASFAQAAAAAGATGIGAATGYMGPETMHVGFGAPSVWGAGAVARTAPSWLKEAVQAGWGGALPEPPKLAPGEIANLWGRANFAPPAEVSALGSRTLRQGMQGPEIRALQQTLSRAGFNVAIDGQFGPQTARALAAYQAASGLEPDGVVGQQTRSALAAEIAAQSAVPTPREKPSSGPLQAALEAAAQRKAAELQQAGGPLGMALPPAEPVGLIQPEQAALVRPEQVSLIQPQEIATAKPPLSGAVEAIVPQTSAEVFGRMTPVEDPLAGVEEELARQGDMVQATNQAIREGWSIKAARNISGEEPLTPSPRANPVRVAEMEEAARIGPANDVTSGTGGGVYSSTPGIAVGGPPPDAPMRSPDFDAVFGPAQGFDAALQSAPTISQKDFAERFGQPSASTPMAASASPAPLSQSSFDARFGSPLNYTQSAPPTMSQAAFDARFGSPAAAAVQSAPSSAAGATGLPGLAPSNVGYAPGMAPNTPTPSAAPYTPVAPEQAAPAAQDEKKKGPLDALSAAWNNPLARAGIGFMTGGPLGAVIGAGSAVLGNALGGKGLLGGLGQSLGSLGYDAATAARTGSFTPSATDMVGGRYGGASYGRTGSDGVTRGTTSSGTGWESRDGGREVSVGGRSYTERRDGRGYSQNL